MPARVKDEAYWEKRKATLTKEQHEAMRDVARAKANLDHWEKQLREAVAGARELEVSWSYIADDLQVSRQAAQQRFGTINET